VGVDIELVRQLDEAFIDSICTPAERRTGARTDPTALWSSKEALAKALGDATQYDPRRLDSPIRWPEGRSGPWRGVALPVSPEYRAWVCWHERVLR
jgi:4'-phosphopantetheinyl transferase EntD